MESISGFRLPIKESSGIVENARFSVCWIIQLESVRECLMLFFILVFVHVWVFREHMEMLSAFCYADFIEMLYVCMMCVERIRVLQHLNSRPRACTVWRIVQRYGEVFVRHVCRWTWAHHTLRPKWNLPDPTWFEARCYTYFGLKYRCTFAVRAVLDGNRTTFSDCMWTFPESGCRRAWAKCWWAGKAVVEVCVGIDRIF